MLRYLLGKKAALEISDSGGNTGKISYSHPPCKYNVQQTRLFFGHFENNSRPKKHNLKKTQANFRKTQANSSKTQ